MVNGTVRGITNGVHGTMSGGVFDVKLAPKRKEVKMRSFLTFLTRATNLHLFLVHYNLILRTMIKSQRE